MSENMTVTSSPAPEAGKKLWFYTNYDCNLRCTYCVAESAPRVPRRQLPLETLQRLVDEAEQLDFDHLFFTGGEPFLHEEIFPMLAYASERLPTTVLTNAMLFRGRRGEQLTAIQNPNLFVQVSLDGGCAPHHDAYRGEGSWAGTVEGINFLLEKDFEVRLSTTETPANTEHLDEICRFHTSLGIPEEAHFIRPLAKRGFSPAGMEVDKASLQPELTVNVEGFYWHPLSTDADLQVRAGRQPLEQVLAAVEAQKCALTEGGAEEAQTFT